MKFYFIFSLFVFASQTAFCEDDLWSWIHISKGKNSNSIIWNLIKNNFLKSELPSFQVDFGFQKKNKKTNLDEALIAVLSGPPDPSSSPNEDSIIITACRAHSCDEKGFLWANSKDKTSIMAIVHYIYQGKYESSPQLFLASKNFKCGEYPEVVMSQLKSWLSSKKVSVQKVRCLQDDKVNEIKI